MVLGTSLPEFNPDKFPFFLTKLSCARHDNTNFAEKRNFPLIFDIPNLSEPRYFTSEELKDPRPTPLENGAPEERRKPQETLTAADNIELDAIFLKIKYRSLL